MHVGPNSHTSWAVTVGVSEREGERERETHTELEPLYSSPSIHLIIHGCVFFLHELRWTPQEQPEPLFSRRKAFNDGKLGLSGKIHSTVELHEMNLLNQPIN